MKILLILMLGMSAFTDSGDKKETVTGYLQLFGSEPFPQIAVVTRENERIFLDLSAEQHEQISQNRQEFIRIKGKIHQKEYMGELHPHIKPVCWKWIDKPDDW
jgi:hypothetical protein